MCAQVSFLLRSLSSAFSGSTPQFVFFRASVPMPQTKEFPKALSQSFLLCIYLVLEDSSTAPWARNLITIKVNYFFLGLYDRGT